MRPKAWVKLWVKELFSSSFSLEQRGAWHSFLQLAAESPTEGIISAAGNKGYPDTMLADYLRCSVAKIKEFKALFAKENMVSVDSKGLITITNWTKYQSEYSRIKKYRNDTDNDTDNDTTNATTPDYRLQTTDNRLQTTEAEEPSATAGVNIFRLFENCIGLVPSALVEELKDAETHYPPEYLEYAFKQAADYNKRSWKYVLGILARCEREGIGEGKKDEPMGDPMEFRRRYEHMGRLA